ncbi:isochorismatase family protein [Clostridium sp. CAG:433]|nr:isochorismatase family protein [Clostridium sp. CAG:433]
MDRKSKKEVYENIRKALYMIDMNNGFVNFGNMANPKYNELVNEQLKLINKFRKENQLVNFVLEGHTTDSIEFDSYPSHCVLGTKEAELIPEFIDEQNKENTRTYYKNSINGMLNRNLQDDIKNQDNLNEIVIGGVCADLCVMDFARTFSRYLDEINRRAKIFVVENTIDTYDSLDHNREEWMDISKKVMTQAGIIMVPNIEELERKEKELGLILK